MKALGVMAAHQVNHRVARWQPPCFGIVPVILEPEPEIELVLVEPEPEPEPEPELPPEPTYPPLTAEELEAIRAEGYAAGQTAGYQEGFQRGYQDGREQGVREALAETQTHVERVLQGHVQALETLAQGLVDPLADAADSLEPDLLLLVTTVAEQVLQVELATRPGLIQAVVQQTLAQLPARHRNVSVHVHPEDHALLEGYIHQSADTLQWVADDSVSRGGCVIESGPSRIDATLTTRLEQAIAAMWGDMPMPTPATIPTPLAPASDDAASPVTIPTVTAAEPESPLSLDADTEADLDAIELELLGAVRDKRMAL